MNRRMMFSVGAAVLALGGTAATGVVLQGHAFATTAPNAKKAAAEAKAARKLLDKHKGEAAVAHAERAVANDPRNPDYRAMLGEAYLLAGRFTSATQALTDALTLNPENGRVALNLSLAKIAAGDWAGARATLQANAERIPASDRGLAVALAGDPVAAIQILAPAAQEPTATAKTRQNLALALALSGRWGEAKAVAETDLPPDQVNARLMQWMAFARPTNAYDQVAALLGVRPVQDGGQPVALALAAQDNVGVAAAAPAPVTQPAESYMPEPAPQVAEASPAEEAPAPVDVASVPNAGAVVFGPHQEIVQPIASRAARRAAPAVVAAKHAAPAAPSMVPRPLELAAGNFYVQLGAFENAAVARDSWRRLIQRVPALGGHAPQGASFAAKTGSFYRLSVGGFARKDAVSLCQRVRSRGATCFVRQQAGDQTARWFKPNGQQLASR